jgi:hypothetical protein
MTIPAKSVPTDGVAAKGQTAARDLFFVFRVQEIPAELDFNGEAGHYPYKQSEISLVVTCATSADYNVKWFMTYKSKPSWEADYSSDISTPTYQSAVLDTTYCDEISHSAQQMAGETRSITVRLRHELEDVSGVAGKIYAFNLECIFGDNYLGNDTSDRTLEQTERLGNDRLYLPDRCFSAWHAKNALCETYNKLTEENRTYYSIPLVDYWFV